MGRAITSATCCPSQCGGVAAPPTLSAQKEVLRYPSQRYHHPRPPVESRRECLGGMGREARGWAEVTREECGAAHCTAGGFGSERPVGRDREREREREMGKRESLMGVPPTAAQLDGRPIGVQANAGHGPHPSRFRRPARRSRSTSFFPTRPSRAAKRSRGTGSLVAGGSCKQSA